MQPASPARRSARPFVILFAVLALIGLGFGIYWWINRDFATTDDAAIDGTICTIAPQIARRVVAVEVTDNQHVTAGQVLVKLDDRDEQVALLHAQATVAQALAQQAQAEAAAEETAATLTQAEQDYKRFTSINPRATTRQQVDAATAAIHAQQAKLSAAEADMQAAAAALTVAKAQEESAKLQLSYTAITAPIDGHVAMKSVQLGNVVAPGSPMMALVGDEVWVTANYKETQLAGIKPGAKATVTVDAYPGVTFKAHVDSVQYGTGAVFSLLPAQNATGNYIKIVQRVPVKIMFNDSRTGRYLLAPGMSVVPEVRVSP